MLNDFKDSIKAKLYDFNYTPFMSSLVISWVVINHKYLLVLFSDKLDIDKKLIMLNDPYSYNAVFSYFGFYILPLAFALFYVYGYPLLAKRFYEYTLESTKELKSIKQKIEDETPITQEEAREIRAQIDKLTTERDDAIQKAVEAENRYRQKYEQQMDAIRTREWTEPSVEQSVVTNKMEEDDETKILRYLYESNYKKDYKSDAISKIVSATKIPLIVVEKITDSLISRGILDQQVDHFGDASITIPKNGSEYLMELFYKNK